MVAFTTAAAPSQSSENSCALQSAVSGTAVRTDDTVVAPLLAGNLFEAGMDGHGDAVPTVVAAIEARLPPSVMPL